MAKAYIFYNPLAGNGRCLKSLDNLKETVRDEKIFYDMTKTSDFETIFNQMDKEDYAVVCGGDGTLNVFANKIADLNLKNEIYYYPSGSGNDLARDLGKKGSNVPFKIAEHLKNLPSIDVNGKTYRFFNGIGYGIDGSCCEVGDKIRKKSNKKINYTLIALKQLLFHYKPVNATVTVDGETHSYERVWLAPTMKGRFFGGGMMPTPDQKRDDPEGKLSLMIMHSSGKLKTLWLFPTIFGGSHVTHTECVNVFVGKDIAVTFDRPNALQIDGETVLNVSSYRVYSELKKSVKKFAEVKS